MRTTQMWAPHLPPGGGGKLLAGRRDPAEDVGDLGEGVAEDVVQDERHPRSTGVLGRSPGNCCTVSGRG
ncbi:hypothetical protein [Streptomyces bacillaris]|uniref:hypothetical protein n=1 Tax=Streptomyces bacillaris TaxID=68179 RepID=UPI0036653B59